MDNQRESLLADVGVVNKKTINDHPLKGTMQWLQEEKGDEFDLVYVVDMDETEPAHNNDTNVVVFKSDLSYKRVKTEKIKRTQEISQSDQWKLHRALFFAAEQSRNSVIVPGSLLVEQYDKIYESNSWFKCLGAGEKYKKRELKGFKVKSYDWHQSNLNGFHGETMGEHPYKSQFQSVSDTAIVINRKDPVQRKLRRTQSEIDGKNQMIAHRDQIIENIMHENEDLKHQLQEVQRNATKQRRNSVHKVDVLQKTIQDSNNHADVLQHDLKKTNEKLETLQNEYHKLRENYIAKMEQLKVVTKHRNELQDRLVDYNADVTTLDTDFPPIEDIVSQFDQARGNLRINCAKKIKKYFRSRNKDSHKLQINKQANITLFDVLMECYAKMNDYHTMVSAECKQSIKTNNEDSFMKACYHKLRKEFQSLFDKIEQEYFESILADIQSKYDGLLVFCPNELWMEYIKECLYICWYIVVCQSPQLKLHPLQCTYSESKNDEDTKKKEDDNAFDNDKYVAVYGSEENEAINYYVWPCIIRADNNYQLSKIHVLFLNEMPKFSKKSMKRMQKASVASNDINS